MADIYGGTVDLASAGTDTLMGKWRRRLRAAARIAARRVPNGGDALIGAACALFALVAFVGYVIDETALSAGWRWWFARAGIADDGSALTLSLLFGALAGRRLRPDPARLPRSATPDLDLATALLARQPSASAGLVRLGDKDVLFSDCGQAFIMYARQGRSLVALFDPVGDRAAWSGLVAKFVDLARGFGCRPVFYQVSADFLPYAVQWGMRPLKLGEQAILDLQRFDTKGGDWVKLRRSINRAERDGLKFEMVQPAGVPALMDELAAVSQAWLDQHNSGEKGFSLGTFKRDYVACEPVAVVRIEGRIVAFATVLTTGNGGDAFIDLMRHVPGVHRGMMDLLFVRLIERLKQEGFLTLNMGMAPLAGLGGHKRAPLWDRIGRRIFENGERFYNFRGVLAFKSKFDPKWEPRYLAVNGGMLPVSTLFDVTLLIGGGFKGIFRR